MFGYAAGRSRGTILFPARELSGRAQRDGPVGNRPDAGTPRYALLGVRSCDLHAIGVQDRSCSGCRVDADYAARREAPSSSPSPAPSPAAPASAPRWAPGPRPEAGFDLALTELLDAAGTASSPGRQRARRRAARGAAAGRPATAAQADLAAADDVVDGAAARWAATSTPTTCATCSTPTPTPAVGRRGRALPGLHQLHAGVPDLLLHPWRTPPTSPATRERWRVWDSCFTSEFSTCTAAACAADRARYRQWLTHKLASWLDQFGTSGCVGLRPVHHLVPRGIDITEEARRASGAAPQRRGPGQTGGKPHEDADHRRVPAGHPFFAGLDDDAICRSAGCAINVHFQAGEYLFREGDPADALLRRPPRPRRPGDARARPPGPIVSRRLGRGRGARLVLAGPAVPLALRRAGPSSRPARSSSTAPACAASATTTRGSATLIQRAAQVMPSGCRPARVRLLDLYGTPMTAAGATTLRRRRRPARAPRRSGCWPPGRRPPTPRTLTLEPPDGAPLRLRRRAVHDARHARRRRGADLDQRRPGSTGRWSTRSATSGGVTRRPRDAPARRRARRARARTATAGTVDGRRGRRRRDRRRRHRAGAAAPGGARGAGRPRRYGRVVAALRRAHARTSCSSATSSSAGRPRRDLDVDVTVDRRRPRLAGRVGLVTAPDRRGPASTRRGRWRWSAAPR